MLRRTFFLAALALAFAGCKPPKPKELTVQQVAAGLKAGTLHAYDANTEEFRQKNGVVPGATLLADHDGYDPASTLPPDKSAPLVFYCTGRL